MIHCRMRVKNLENENPPPPKAADSRGVAVGHGLLPGAQASLVPAWHQHRRDLPVGGSRGGRNVSAALPLGTHWDPDLTLTSDSSSFIR